MRNYLFIAYKPDSVDYCRGCRMGSYDSDHAIEKNLSREELIEVMAKYYVKNLNLGCNESPYSFWVFNKGIQVLNEDYVDCAYGYDLPDEEYSKQYENIEKANEELSVDINDILKQVEVLAKDKKAIAERLKKEADLKKRQEEAAKVLAEKERQYDSLKRELNKE